MTRPTCPHCEKSLPDAVLRSGMGFLRSQAAPAGGRKPKPTKCKRCGVVCPSARLARAHPCPPPIPRCDECNNELIRYGPALDTGKDGWMCDLCGWSWDDE